MTVIALAGGKGSPGTTTLAVALSAVMTADNRALLVEVDPAGGDLAARYGLALDPGLLSLAAAGRRGLTMDLIASHAQRLGSDTRVLLAPTSPDQAASILSGLASTLARTLLEAAERAIVDVGRWDARSPAVEFVRNSSLAVLVVRPTIDGVEHARWQLPSLRDQAPRVAVVSIGERPYPPDEVRLALGVDDLYVVDYDTRAARSLGLGAAPDRWLRRYPLLRSVTVLAEELRGHFDDEAVVR